MTVLATKKSIVNSASARWKSFLHKRESRLVQVKRHDGGSEKITENILEDLFTEVLDWKTADINYQVKYSDMILTHLGIKYLLVEAKSPYYFAGSESRFNAALQQALRYAQDHAVSKIAICDGARLYAVDVKDASWALRVDTYIDQELFPEELWRLSIHGIYRDEETEKLQKPQPNPDERLIHKKHKLPAAHFAYVGDVTNPDTWSLPYRLLDMSVDLKRLPKAIGAIIANYRGKKVKKIPEQFILDVLRALHAAAREAHMMPDQNPLTPLTYRKLSEVLTQLPD